MIDLTCYIPFFIAPALNTLLVIILSKNFQVSKHIQWLMIAFKVNPWQASESKQTNDYQWTHQEENLHKNTTLSYGVNEQTFIHIQLNITLYRDNLYILNISL